MLGVGILFDLKKLCDNNFTRIKRIFYQLFYQISPPRYSTNELFIIACSGDGAGWIKLREVISQSRKWRLGVSGLDYNLLLLQMQITSSGHSHPQLLTIDLLWSRSSPDYSRGVTVRCCRFSETPAQNFAIGCDHDNLSRYLSVSDALKYR